MNDKENESNVKSKNVVGMYAWSKEYIDDMDEGKGKNEKELVF
jgi:hypothetical protein